MIRFWSSVVLLLGIPITVFSVNDNGDAGGVEVIGEDGVKCIQQFKKDEAKALFDIDIEDSMMNSFYVDGDQILELRLCKGLETAGLPNHKRKKRQIYNFETDPARKWDIPVKYELSPLFDDESKDTIRGALSHFEANTCIRFQEIDSVADPQTDTYLYFSYSSSCASFVGKAEPLEGRLGQDIFLTQDCIDSLGETVHVVAQSLGLWHVHQRGDRDDYVTINQQHVKEDEQASFSTISDEYLDTQGLPYDYASVMHFSGFTFKDGKSPANAYTLQTADRKNQKTIGQRTGLSFSDIRALNLGYCANVCDGYNPDCENGGYADPNDCNKCKCKDGFAGDLCEDLERARNADCGGVLEASLTELFISSPGFNFPYNSYYEPHQECTWLIRSPNKEKIQMRFKDAFGVFCVDQTCQHWVELRLGDDKTELGERICCNELPEETFTSTNDEVMILFRTNYTFKVQEEESIGFRLGYQVVSENPCDYITCENGGTCSRDLGTCECLSGFRGNRCQTDLCEDNGSCQNGGTCQVAPTYWAGYRCSCPPGFIGLTCQINFCDEARMTCRNGGTCEPKPGGFNCACHEGYTGTRCEKEVDECASSPCLNNGICMDKVNGYDCLCGEDYSGINCENLIFTDSCESEPCQNGGECDNLAGGKFACQCTDGYHGDTCEEKAENCGGCGEVGGALAPACKKKGGSTERCSKMKVVRSYTGHAWWRRMVERTVIVWGECDTDNYYCCDNAILVELNEGVRCAVPGWSSWGPCSSRCGGCGTQTRFKWQLANYQTRGNRRVQWRICDTESRDCNTNPCEDCSLYGCSKCCGSRGYRYRRPHRRCVHC